VLGHQPDDGLVEVEPHTRRHEQRRTRGNEERRGSEAQPEFHAAGHAAVE
jgi:hypothetical protein